MERNLIHIRYESADGQSFNLFIGREWTERGGPRWLTPPTVSSILHLQQLHDKDWCRHRHIRAATNSTKYTFLVLIRKYCVRINIQHNTIGTLPWHFKHNTYIANIETVAPHYNKNQRPLSSFCGKLKNKYADISTSRLLSDYLSTHAFDRDC